MMLSKLKEWFFPRSSSKQKIYSLIDTFGCTECPPQDCPTFIVRKVHRKFQNALQSYNIIVVYGESRQGKTWSIERYCPVQLRIGCTANMSFEQIKIAMLHAIDKEIRVVEHTVTDAYTKEGGVSGTIGTQLTLTAGLSTSTGHAHKEVTSTTYPTIDLSNTPEFLEILRSGSEGKYFVFDNFHYLSPNIQQQFCAMLKEFNYQGIKVIIVGVWKDASRITALAPDLVNRCEHIDIGSWSKTELDEVIKKGELALNIHIDDYTKDLFKSCCANNIGIFKDFVQKYCQKFSVIETQKIKKELCDRDSADQVAEEVVTEAFSPLHDRFINLALPQRDTRKSKYMRQKIIVTVLQIIIESEMSYVQNGIPLSLIKSRVDTLCDELHEEKIGISNLTQELGVLHQREENRQTDMNFISLFYFDKANKKLLILEPTIYELKGYKVRLLVDIMNELKESLLSKKACTAQLTF